jgi:nicotinate-nucleotide pyrophosphorylase (carboxylating)
LSNRRQADVPPLDPEAIREFVARALAEDVGTGDLTTMAVVPDDLTAAGIVLAKSDCVVCGLAVAAEVCRQVDERLVWRARVHDGDTCGAGMVMADLRGPAAAMLVAERTLLNVLQQWSGIATLTRRFVDSVAGRIAVLDTRKTTPTLRMFEKYAVRCGGGTNHRAGLFDGVLIKDNHIRIAGGVGEAVARVRSALAGRTPVLPIEVEAQTIAQVQDALEAGVDIIMLDNLTDAEMVSAVALINQRSRIEVSGGVTLERLATIAASGADWVSVGALTHSAPAVDISLEIEAG